VLVVEKLNVGRESDGQCAANSGEPSHVVLDLVVTKHITTVELSTGVVGSSKTEEEVGRGELFATVIREMVAVAEAREASKVASTEGTNGGSNLIVVTEDGTSGQSANRGNNRGIEINVEVVAEELRVKDGLSIHDAAVHVVTLVDEETVTVDITVERTLATVLPATIDIGTVGSGSTAWASVLAHVLTSTAKRIGNATMRSKAVNTWELVAVDAIIIACSNIGNRSFATVLRITVAISETSVANEDAVTTSSKVRGIAIAIGENSGNVDVVDSAGLSATKDLEAIERGDVPGNTIANELLASIKANGVTEIVQGARAKVALSAARVGGSRLTNLTPTLIVLATVTRIGVAILPVIEATVVDLEASRLVAASTSIIGSSTTFAEDSVKAVRINVLLLSEEEVLRPSRAVE
jgi:hypothetical protein